MGIRIRSYILDNVGQSRSFAVDFALSSFDGDVPDRSDPKSGAMALSAADRAKPPVGSEGTRKSMLGNRPAEFRHTSYQEHRERGGHERCSPDWCVRWKSIGRLADDRRIAVQSAAANAPVTSADQLHREFDAMSGFEATIASDGSNVFSIIGERQFVHVATCDGHSFPTNVDRDPPTYGIALETQAACVKHTLSEGLDERAFYERLN